LTRKHDCAHAFVPADARSICAAVATPLINVLRRRRVACDHGTDTMHQRDFARAAPALPHVDSMAPISRQFDERLALGVGIEFRANIFEIALAIDQMIIDRELLC